MLLLKHKQAFHTESEQDAEKEAPKEEDEEEEEEALTASWEGEKGKC